MGLWLVTWEYSGNHAKVDNPIAAILNYRYPAKRIKDIVELIYVNTYFSLSERLAYARNKKNTAYPAEYDTIEGIPWEGRILCGHNPFLDARLVDELILNVDENGKEILSWIERKKPTPPFFKHQR
jgi:hypothetical protein